MLMLVVAVPSRTHLTLAELTLRLVDLRLAAWKTQKIA
jgi:hypothetical protein